MIIELHQYVLEMRIAQFSEVTIRDRVELLQRFATFTGKPLTATDGDDIRAFQQANIHLAPASQNIYSRHVKALLDWASKRRIIDHNPADEMIVPRVLKGRPHPTRLDDLKTIFACAHGVLRIVFVLAAFTGVRRGEICQIQARDIDINGHQSNMLVHGKGAKERTVPLLRPVVEELRAYGIPRAGWVVRGAHGGPMHPDYLSQQCSRFFADIGISTTLHSMRHAFATHSVQLTHDLLLVRDLLGHQSVATTEIYAQSDVEHIHLRLAGFATLADEIRGAGPGRPQIRAVGQ